MGYEPPIPEGFEVVRTEDDFCDRKPMHEHLQEWHGITITDPYSLLWQCYGGRPTPFQGIKQLHWILHKEEVWTVPHVHRKYPSRWDRFGLWDCC